MINKDIENEDVEKPDLSKVDCYSHWTKDSVRYGDTDRQGHVNNAVFTTFLESGRVAILYNPEKPLAPTGTSFVIARLVLDFRSQIFWPSDVAIGTAVIRLGKSSLTFGQGIFVNNKCAAIGETVIVLIDEKTHKSFPLPEETRKELLKCSPNKVSFLQPPASLTSILSENITKEVLGNTLLQDKKEIGENKNEILLIANIPRPHY